jgi:superfamily II DNA helicase RecQ
MLNGKPPVVYTSYWQWFGRARPGQRAIIATLLVEKKDTDEERTMRARGKERPGN